MTQLMRSRSPLCRPILYHIGQRGPGDPFMTRTSATTFSLLRHHFLVEVKLGVPPDFDIYVVQTVRIGDGVRTALQPETTYSGCIPVDDPLNPLEVVLLPKTAKAAQPPRPAREPITLKGPFGYETFY